MRERNHKYGVGEPPLTHSVIQPFKLLHRYRLSGVLGLTRPREFFCLQTLGSQAETVAMPVQDVDLVAVPVDEHVQRASERIELEFLLARPAPAS